MSELKGSRVNMDSLFYQIPAALTTWLSSPLIPTILFWVVVFGGASIVIIMGIAGLWESVSDWFENRKQKAAWRKKYPTPELYQEFLVRRAQAQLRETDHEFEEQE